MKSPPQSRFILIFLIFMVIEFFIGLVMIETQYKPLVVIFFSGVFIASYFLRRIKYPSCEMPIIYQGKVLGVSIYGAICRRKCANCGHDLIKPST
jgi:hypothetical protein